MAARIVIAEHGFSKRPSFRPKEGHAVRGKTVKELPPYRELGRFPERAGRKMSTGMGSEHEFALSDRQREGLLTCRAAWEEDEGEERLERLRQREEDTEMLRAVAELLKEARFADGRALNHAETTRLLTLVRVLGPNPSLDARLLRTPDEPAAFSQDLRALLYGKAALPLRLRVFLARRAVAGQTATQLLCAVFPTEQPFITQRGTRALELSTEQRVAALQAARQRYDLPSHAAGQRPGVPDSDPTLRLLAAHIVYEAVREAVAAPDYVEVHRLLTECLAADPRRRRSAGSLLYAQRGPAPATVREPEAADYSTQREPEPAPPGAPSPAPETTGVRHREVLQRLEEYVAAEGFTYPDGTVRDLYISLQTKPFCILAGISGTGKTRLTSLFAEALTGDSDRQYRLLPVRPDWADSTPVLGYVNLLTPGPEGRGRFVSTPFLDFVRRAAQPENAHRAFFLCLDEMNLARIEHYFAEVLSAMETPTRELLLPDGRALRLPANLFLTGTLNLDESTHTLSRKVLDRANTLVLRDVSLREEPETVETPERAETPTPEVCQALFLYGRVRTVAAARTKLRGLSHSGESFADHVINRLAEANDILEPHGLHFAYRVRDEVLRYCANSFDTDGAGLLNPKGPDDGALNLNVALDFQVLQKVLPRLSGTRETLDRALRDMHRWAERAGLARTVRKLERMRFRLERDGFVTFEEV